MYISSLVLIKRLAWEPGRVWVGCEASWMTHSTWTHTGMCCAAKLSEKKDVKYLIHIRPMRLEMDITCLNCSGDILHLSQTLWVLTSFQITSAWGRVILSSLKMLKPKLKVSHRGWECMALLWFEDLCLGVLCTTCFYSLFASINTECPVWIIYHQAYVLNIHSLFFVNKGKETNFILHVSGWAQVPVPDPRPKKINK